MTVSVALRVVAVWFTVSVSLAVAAFLHAGSGEDGAS